MRVDFSRWKWGFIILSVLVTGCETAPMQAVSLTPCVPAEQDANPYLNPSKSTANIIYQYSQASTPGSETANKLAAQDEAFRLLVREVRKWSDHVDLLVDGNLVVRVTVIFVSPEIVEGVILNQRLSSGIPVADFPAEVQHGKDDIAKRNELLFFVMFTASDYKERLLPNDPLLVELPVGNMKLTNSAKLSVEPSHRDDHLANQINLRFEPEHGTVAYPIAVEQGLDCQWIMNPSWNTVLALHVPNLYVNNTDYGPFTWKIDYRSLVLINSPDYIPSFMPPPTGEELKFSPSQDAPRPMNGISLSDTTHWSTYWEGVSRYLWYHIANSSHH